MKVILEQVTDIDLCEIVEITSLDQLLEIATQAKRKTVVFEPKAAVILSEVSLLHPSHNHPDIKWHVTIYDGYIE